MDPADLNKLQAELESYADSYTIGKSEDSNITMVTSALLSEPSQDFPLEYHLAKAKEIADLLKDVSKFIPPFRAVFSPEDNPVMAADWALKSQALQAAAARTCTYITPSESALQCPCSLTDINISEPPLVKHLGWPSACSPDSLLRHTIFDFDVPPPLPTKKTFIYDHLKAMDPCSHPSLLHHHGQFLRHNPGPIPQQIMIPMFSYCSTSMHHNIVTAVKWTEDFDIDPKFHDRLDERLSWRGTTTGMQKAKFVETRWRNLPRIRLVGWANERNGTAPVLPPTKLPNERVGEARPIAKARLNPAMLDVTFIGKPHSCTQSVCEIIAEEFEFRDWQDEATAANYKYVLDVSNLCHSPMMC